MEVEAAAMVSRALEFRSSGGGDLETHLRLAEVEGGTLVGSDIGRAFWNCAEAQTFLERTIRSVRRREGIAHQEAARDPATHRELLKDRSRRDNKRRADQH